jgi:glyoxylase-like metal-dependent hydrolase (beta-lactamase superfamily II)
MKSALDSAVYRKSASSFPAPGVKRLKHILVNSFILFDPGSTDWFLVDAGLSRFSAWTILRHAARRFGPDRPPRAIILTHGHFDHVGAIQPLLKRWQVPVYAHPLEMPFLTGEADYLPPDPRVGGGLMAWLAFLYPRRGIDISDRVQELPADGSIPGLPQWRWIHTPGHTPGHVALFRETDRTLIPADAFITVKQESFWAVMTQKPTMHGPPMYFTPDWQAARNSVRQLAALKPNVVAAGHGLPMHGPEVQRELDLLAENFDRVAVPKHGRYVKKEESLEFAPTLEFQHT